MEVDDLANDRKAQSGAALLGGEKWLEQPGLGFLIDPGTFIGNDDSRTRDLSSRSGSVIPGRVVRPN